MIIALALAFLLELVAFAAFAALPFAFDIGRDLQIVLSVLLLILLIVFWSIFMAPKAAKKLKIFPYYICKAAVYAVSAYSLVQIADPGYAIAFAAAVALDEAVLYKHNLG